MPRRDPIMSPRKSAWRCVKARTCDNKRAYPTMQAALVALGNDRRMAVYRCPFSDTTPHWHIGHPPSRSAMRKLAYAIRARAQEAA